MAVINDSDDSSPPTIKLNELAAVKQNSVDASLDEEEKDVVKEFNDVQLLNRRRMHLLNGSMSVI